MLIRPEVPSDYAAIRALHAAAFPTGAEADLVDRLRADGDAVIALVALDDRQTLVGHVVFSRMRAPFRALGLAPVAVVHRARRQGIAAQLIREGLAMAKHDGYQSVFVLGDPAYYTRFGFSAEHAAPFASPFAGPHLMAMPLHVDRMPAREGRVDYAPAFGAFG